MDYQDNALFGGTVNNSSLNAIQLNPDASGSDDWQTILTNGISTAVANGINGMVNNAVASGQLQNTQQQQAITRKDHTTLLIMAAVVYFLVKG